MQSFLHINNISFAYDRSAVRLFDSVSFQLQRGWTGIVGPNGSGKTTLLRLLTGDIRPDSGVIQYAESAYYCEQRTDDPPAEFAALLKTQEKRVFRIKTLLEIEDVWASRWPTLSHGERKRCQIATALFLDPSFLAIDEPSNHLDRGSRKVLYDALRTYAGIGVLVSHDRELLDNLCAHTLFIAPDGIDLRKCNYRAAARERKIENESKLQKRELFQREAKKLKRKVAQQRAKADKADAQRSKKGLAAGDHDAKSKLDLARLTGKDALAGRQHRRLRVKLERTEQQRAAIEFTKTYSQGISFNERKAAKLFPMSIAPDMLRLGEHKKLVIPDLLIQYGEKIGIIGDNGTGKSSFLRYFIKKYELPEAQSIYIPQEIEEERSRALIDRIQRYDGEKMGQLLSLVRRLGSDPTHLLDTALPSPGEIRKLLLAEGILLQPSIIIMDEPTNHMDLPSIECVEKALVENNCTQLLVSHDRIFLNNVVDYFWIFEPAQDNGYTIRNI